MGVCILCSLISASSYIFVIVLDASDFKKNPNLPSSWQRWFFVIIEGVCVMTEINVLNDWWSLAGLVILTLCLLLKLKKELYVKIPF